jgi:hypothetical protein
MIRFLTSSSALCDLRWGRTIQLLRAPQIGSADYWMPRFSLM